MGANTPLSLLETSVGPAALVLSLWAAAWYAEGDIAPSYLILSVLAFALTFPGKSRLQSSISVVLLDIALNWLCPPRPPR